MRKQNRLAFTLIELMIVVAIIGILAAVAVPNFLKFQARSKQSEVKLNMKAIFTGQKAYYQEKDSYSENMCDIAFAPERGNRYTYWTSDHSSGASNAYRSDSSDQLAAKCQAKVSVQGLGADTFQYGTNNGITNFMYDSNGISAPVNTGSTGNFTSTAFGNIDNDPDYDDWSVSSFTRTAAAVSDATTSCAAGNNPSGEPCNDYDDI